MIACASRFLRRHPLVRDAILWSMPAMLAGAVLRWLLLSYSPYAYFGSDGESFISFAWRLLTSGDISIDAKRRYLYPIFLLPLSALPGSPLRWVAWFQHVAGLLIVVPLGYTVRKCMARWQWTIIPVTLAYATMPMVLWQEHEVLAEHLFFSALILAVAGWCAWIKPGPDGKQAPPFWWFYCGLAALTLTKPSARFFWPGLLAGIALCGAWRRFERRQWVALLLLFAAMLTVGEKGQGLRLLYTTAFPLTRLDTPHHAEFKAEIRSKVEPLRERIWAYHALESEKFLRAPWDDPDTPAWRRLKGNQNLRNEIYRDLALEAVRSNPGLFLSIGYQRAVASAEPGEFETNRFEADYAAVHFRPVFDERIHLIPFLLARPVTPGDEGYKPVAQMLSPCPDSRAALWLRAFVDGWQEKAALFSHPPMKHGEDKDIRLYRPTALCWLLMAGMVLSFLPAYRRTLGIWTLACLSYTFGVFLVGSVGPRYLAPAYFIFMPLLAVPFDILLNFIAVRVKGRKT
jgi:hypothetical protein